jgi:Recombination directionality factor-like
MKHGVMYGLTHSIETGLPIIKEPKVLKVGIGVPRGRAISIFIWRGKWVMRFGVYEGNKLTMKTVAELNTRQEAEEYYYANRDKAALSDRPQKLPFFTFTKRTVIDVKGKSTEVFEPDFEAIEANGECPKELDVVFMSENPYHGQYQLWSATELKCHGDGLEGMRSVSMGGAQDAGWKQAQDAGLRMFPVKQCWTNGCKYAQEGGGCKPGVTLTFQLANNMRLGATAYFHTTSIRSAQQIFSALETIRQTASKVGSTMVGLPVKMVLTPFKSNHNGQVAMHYGVSLEIRAEDMKALRQRILESAWQASAEPKMLVAPIEPLPVEMEAEFYTDVEEVEEETAPPIEAAVQTNKKTEELAQKLKDKKNETVLQNTANTDDKASV